MKIVQNIECSYIFCKRCKFRNTEEGRCEDLNTSLGEPDPKKGHRRLAKCIARELSQVNSKAGA
jgi:hypothetical protein